jgi:hypothetical protein
VNWIQKRRIARKWRRAQRDIARHDRQFNRDHPDWEKKYGTRRTWT